MSKPNVPTPADALPEGFKMTELGPLPEEWQVVRLGEVATLTLGRTPPRAENRYWEKGEVSWVSIADLNNSYVLNTKETISKLAYQRFFGGRSVPAGTLLLSFKLTIGKVGILGIPAVHNEAIVSVYPQSGTCRDYLFYLFQGYDFDFMLDSYVKGKTLNKNKLERLPIPLPPLAEQRAIAHALRTVQEAKEATERVIVALKELKKSLMRHLFTYGPVPLDKTDTVPMQETEIGPIPAHWQVVRLGEVGKVITGKTPPTNQREYWDGPIPFITPADLIGRPISNAQRSISYKGLQKAKPLPKNTVLVSCIGYLGKVGVVDSEIAVTNQQINAIIPNQSIATWFLAYALMNETQLLESRARMTTVPILHKTNFERIPIPLPPLAEQQEIARILQAVDEKIAAEEKRRSALAALFKSLLAQLMSGRVRVPYEEV